MILTVTLNAAIDKRYVVDDYKVGEVNRVREGSTFPEAKVSMYPNRPPFTEQKL